MKHCYRLLSVIVLSLVAATVWAEDPGLPDTVRIESRPVPVGVSTPIGISIFNDGRDQMSESIMNPNGHLFLISKVIILKKTFYCTSRPVTDKKLSRFFFHKIKGIFNGGSSPCRFSLDSMTP